MVAWLTRGLLLAQATAGFGLYLLLVHYFGWQSKLLAALTAVVAVVAVRLLIVLNNFTLAHCFRSPRPPACRLRWSSGLALFFGEAAATLIASSWHMPFRRLGARIVPDARGLPVLLIHGYGCNSGYWRPMSSALLQARIRHVAIDLEPVFASIDTYAPRIHAAVEQICRDTGSGQVVILAHSMGGLAARAYLRQFGCGRVAKVITLGTPHNGTALARFATGINTQEMVWMASEQEGLASDWLRSLAQSEPASTCALLTSIYSLHDNIIAPQHSSHLRGARNIAMKGIGHVALARNREVQSIVIDEILAVGATSDSTATGLVHRPRQAGQESHAAGG